MQLILIGLCLNGDLWWVLNVEGSYKLLYTCLEDNKLMVAAWRPISYTSGSWWHFRKTAGLSDRQLLLTHSIYLLQKSLSRVSINLFSFFSFSILFSVFYFFLLHIPCESTDCCMQKLMLLLLMLLLMIVVLQLLVFYWLWCL